MAVRMRLMRVGKRHRPSYRICVFDGAKARGSRYVESIGHYDPLTRDEAKKVTVDTERAARWLEVGARPSETVETFLRRLGVPGVERTGRRQKPRKRPSTAEAGKKRKKPSKEVIARAKERAEKTRKRRERRAARRKKLEAQAAAESK